MAATPLIKKKKKFEGFYVEVLCHCTFKRLKKNLAWFLQLVLTGMRNGKNTGQCKINVAVHPVEKKDCGRFIPTDVTCLVGD